jgi:tetratricopeptide (TPR) repeat protein
VGLIIRICSTVLVGMLATTPAFPQKSVSTPLTAYVQGRAAEAEGKPSAAALAYANALSVEPKNAALAVRAYRQAMSAGNRALALRAARALEAGGSLTADARVLLYLDAIDRSDWRGARLVIDAIEEQASFDFLVPTLRAWVSFAARDGDALEPFMKRSKSNLTELYSREHRTLIMAALKQMPQALAAVNEVAGNDQRGISLRLAVAAQMVEAKDRTSALTVLTVPNAVLVTARARVERGEALPDSVASIQHASGILFARIAADLLQDNAPAPALTLARMAIFAAPGRDESKLTLAQALTAANREDEALEILATINKQSPIASIVRNARLSTLIAADRMGEALETAKVASVSPQADFADFLRLGEIYSQLSNHAQSASAYERAIALAAASPNDGPALWGLWLRFGGALDRAGDWKRAKPALERAVALAPDQASALNHLGYAMLERGDDLATAMRFIARASALSPDDAQITDSLGWALFKQNQIAEAIGVLERAVAKEPREAAIGEHLGDAYWSAGRRVDARYAWGAALTQAETSDATRIQIKITNGLPPAAK